MRLQLPPALLGLAVCVTISLAAIIEVLPEEEEESGKSSLVSILVTQPPTSPTSTTPIPDRVDSSTPPGDYRTSCGRRYFFSTSQVTQLEAFARCSQLPDMMLADLQDSQESRCIIKTYVDNYNEAGVLMTSGQRDRANPRLINRFLWRGSGTDYAFTPDIPWMPGEPHPSGKGHDCVALYVYKEPIKVDVDFRGATATFSGIFDTPCSRQYSYVCEETSNTSAKIIESHPPPSPSTQLTQTAAPTISTTILVTTPAPPTTTTNTVVVVTTRSTTPQPQPPVARAAVVTIAPSIDLKTICGKRYFFSTELITQDKAFPRCNSLGSGLVLADIESKQEMSCIISYYTANFNEAGVLMTSGKRDRSIKNIINRFLWNGTGTPKTFGPDTQWMPGEPHPQGKGHDCVAIYIYKQPIRVKVDFRGATAMFSGIFDTPCDRTYTYLCEQYLPASQALLSAVDPCRGPTCSSSAPCQNVAPVDEKKFSDIPKKLGAAIKGCRKYYFFSDLLLTYRQAEDKCCELGLRLLSVETSSELTCLDTLFRGRQRPSQTHWTSGSRDLACPQTLGWCGIYGRRLENTAPWCLKEPHNWGGQEDCVAAIFPAVLGQGPCLALENCANLLPFICEGS